MQNTILKPLYIKNFLSKNSFLIIFYFLIYIFFAKLGASSPIQLWLVLIPIIFSIIGITLLSPAIATALVFMSHNLIGQITMNHPGVLVQVFPAMSLLVALLFVRRIEIKHNLYYWKNIRLESWALLAILIVFLIGFSNGVFTQLSLSSLTKITDLFKASHGGTVDYYPYVFLSRWGVFILFGALCCRGVAELKTFLLALAVLVTSQLIAIPLETYKQAYSDVCMGNTGDGLQALNINRAYLGYLLSISSFILITFALYEKKRIAILYYISAITAMCFCVLAGSKGAYLALLLSVIFLISFNVKKFALKFLILGFLAMSLGAFFTFSLGCHNSYKYFTRSYKATAVSSVSVRSDLAKGVYQKTSNVQIYKILFGSGLGSSIVTMPITFLKPNNQLATIIMGSGSHNLFLDFLVDLGILGVGIFITSSLVLVFCFYKNVLFFKNDFMGTLMGGILVILLVYSLLATAPSMATIQALFLGVLFGVGIKIRKTDKSYESIN